MWIYIKLPLVEQEFTYKSTGEPTIEEEIKTKEPKKKRRRAVAYIPSQDHLWRKTYKKITANINNTPLETTA